MQTCSTEGGGRGGQMESLGSEVSSPYPPALPPRPPPRPRPTPLCPTAGCCSPLQADISGVGISPPTPGHYEPPPEHPPHTTTHSPGPGVQVAAGGAPAVQRQCWSSALRKYVILCTACGGMAALLGALFLLVHFVLRAHTSSLHYFETVPTYVPAVMLTVTGLVVMCFARRRNRYGYLIKVCGVCCLLCAVLCVVVTVTTTVIHMNRLQTLRECVYTQEKQACTCYSGLVQDSGSDEGMRFVFHNTQDCAVVHGALYSCLRALFGLSVIGILVCIFSCMLVYQLLSHEKKKMYWEQLEMRCRYLYGRRNPQYAYCGCSCDECPRFPPAPAAAAATPHAELYPWPPWEQPGYLDDRYWSPPRVGNLYTPSPEEQNASQQPAHNTAGGNARWSWLPWNRGSGGGSAPSNPPGVACQPQQMPEVERTYRGDPDSQYGFGARGSAVQNPPRAAQVVPLCRPLAAPAFVTESSGGLGVGGLPRYLWGPPPSYSQPPSTASNSSSASPARAPPDPQPLSCYPRHLHAHHLHHLHHHCEQPPSHPGSPQHRPASPQSPATRRSVAGSPCCGRIRADDGQGMKELLPSSGSGGNNTLPCRKPKKRPSESPVNAVKGPQQQVGDVTCGAESPGGRKGVGLASSLRGLFGAAPGSPGPHHVTRALPQSAPSTAANSPHKSSLSTSPPRRLPPTPCLLVTSRPTEPTESEVYFADVSSCNGGPDSSLYDEPNAPSEQRDSESAQYASIPSPPGSRLRRPRYAERLAPDAQYEPRGHEASGAPPEDDAPMRDSDATIDSGVHSGSELVMQASRMRPPPSLRDEQQLAQRSVNV